MSDDLRDDLERAILRKLREDPETSWGAPMVADDYADALMPVIRQHLAQAWDDGVTSCDEEHRSNLTHYDEHIQWHVDKPNPWREDDQ